MVEKRHDSVPFLQLYHVSHLVKSTEIEWVPSIPRTWIQTLPCCYLNHCRINRTFSGCLLGVLNSVLNRHLTLNMTKPSFWNSQQAAAPTSCPNSTFARGVYAKNLVSLDFSLSYLNPVCQEILLVLLQKVSRIWRLLTSLLPSPWSNHHHSLPGLFTAITSKLDPPKIQGSTAKM